MVITRVAPMSVARIAGVLYAFLGLFIGFLFSMVTVMGGGPAEQAGLPAIFVSGAAVFVLPIVYGFAGFCMSLIGAAFYNVLAGMLGGIEIETSSEGRP
jgi:hypothetical protein